jgi:hypothetical protein
VRNAWSYVCRGTTLCFLTSLLFAQTKGAVKNPCQDPQGHPEFRQLDFWAGTWEVFNKDKKLSDVRVDKILNDCALAETWSAAGAGHDGRGLSSYDVLTKRWHYYWVADNGYMSHWDGDLMGNELRFVRQPPDPTGGTRLRRWSLFNLPDGTVRELSLDNGKTWTTEYDYLWTRTK